MWPKKRAEVEQAIISTHATQCVDNEKFIHFLYLILFGREAEQAAIDHWKPYLEKGLVPLDLFHSLWNSEEFKAKEQQNRYLKAPQSEEALGAVESAIITDEYFEKALKMVAGDRLSVLEITKVRAAVAQWRYRDLMQTHGVTEAQDAEFAIPDTIAYNEFALRSYVDCDRSNHMVRPLLSIGRVIEQVSELKVLSIGPRTEMELFALLAGGFALENITMIDLFTYSPFIQIGDMHNMAFEANQFDIIVFGDVLAYSKTPEIAVKEIIRVAKHKAIISNSHGLTKGYSPLLGQKNEHADITSKTKYGLSVQSTEDIINCFRPHVGQIYFRCEPENPRTPILNRVLTIFEIVKQ